MAYCFQCQRSFPSHFALNQHFNTSDAHNRTYAYECDGCDGAFSTENGLRNHCSSSHSVRYCSTCDRMFMNANNLMQHMHSKIHQGDSEMKCPSCKKGYATASAVVIHLESGSCSSGMNRQSINQAIQNLDRNHVITNKLLTMPGYENATPAMATEHSWNGHGYQCYLCPRHFPSLVSLNSHMRSPVHEQNLYHCPKRSCNGQFKLLSSLVQHVESESCGVMQFSQVQQTARNGVENFVGKMIQY